MAAEMRGGGVMARGYVYVLTNPAMPDLVKIGSTIVDPDARAKDLSRPTGVPEPFRLGMYAFFDDCRAVERELHDSMRGFRVSERREFFRDGLLEAARRLYHHPKRLAFVGRASLLEELEVDRFGDLLNPWKAVI
jgi:hypothetical protein